MDLRLTNTILASSIRLLLPPGSWDSGVDGGRGGVGSVNSRPRPPRAERTRRSDLKRLRTSGIYLYSW